MAKMGSVGNQQTWVYNTSIDEWISGSTGGGGTTNVTGTWRDPGNTFVTTGSVSIDTSNRTASQIGSDVFFFVSGSQNTPSGANRKATVFGGDTVFSSSVTFLDGVSGSIQQTAAGLSYLVAGSNITIISASNGQITISSTGGGGGSSTSNAAYHGFTTASVFWNVTGAWTPFTGALSGSSFTDAIAQSITRVNSEFTILSGGNYYFHAGFNAYGNNAYISMRLRNSSSNIIGLSRSTFRSTPIDQSPVLLDGIVNVAAGDTWVLEYVSSGTVYPWTSSNPLPGGDNMRTGEVSMFLLATTLSGTSNGSNTFVTGTWRDAENAFVTTGSVSIDANNRTASQLGSDVYFFVSGTQGLSGSSSGKISVFGGDVRISGSLTVGTNSTIITTDSVITTKFSGSLQQTSAGLSYLVAGQNVTITSASNGQITIASTATSTTAATGTWRDAGNAYVTTGSVSIDASNRTASQLGSDVFFYVSGTQGLSGSSAKISVFGGDVRVSGTLTIGTGSVVISNSGIVLSDDGYGNTKVFASLQTSGALINNTATTGSIIYTTTLDNYQYLDLTADVFGANLRGCRKTTLSQSFMRFDTANNILSTSLTKVTSSMFRGDFDEPSRAWTETLRLLTVGTTSNIQLEVTGSGIIDWTTFITLNRRQTYITSLSSTIYTPVVDPSTYSSYLLAWYRADDVTLNGSYVTKMTDKSGNGRHLGQGGASATYAPKYLASDPKYNNQPSVNFDGVANVLTGTIWNLSNQSGVGYTMFMVFNPKAFDGSDSYWDVSADLNTNGYAQFIGLGTDQVRFSASGWISITHPTANAANYYTFSIATGSWERTEVWVKGISSGSTTQTPVASKPANIRIGELFNDVFPLSGSYAEFIIFSGTLPTSARTAMENYIASRYAIT
jgi:hypothetical protein